MNYHSCKIYTNENTFDNSDKGEIVLKKCTHKCYIVNIWLY